MASTVVDEEEDADFGAEKMNYFKKRARDILMNDEEMEYEGAPMPLGNAYKALKHAVKNPSVTYTHTSDKPHHMKMTFCMGRQAPAGQKITELAAKAKRGSQSSVVKNI